MGDRTSDLTTLPLGDGFVAVLLEHEFTLAPPGTPPRTKRPPVRRWAFNSHVWETCDCLDCRARQLGVRGSGYGVPRESQK